MRSFVAIHWSDQQIRLAKAVVEGESLRVDSVRSIVVPADAEALQVRDMIAQFVDELHLRGSEVVVVIDRDRIEMRQIELPPAPEEELADMVRMQARNLFSNFNEANVVDFIRIGNGGENSPIHVLASTINSAELKRVQSTLEAVRLKPKHLLPRPFAVVNLIQSALGSAKYQLLINDFGEEADLTVTYRNRIVLTRTVRLPHSSVEQQATLQKEVRRTLAASRNQPKGGVVERVVILGDNAKHQALAATIGDELRLPVETLRTGDFVAITPAVREAIAEDDGSFGPLLGSLSVGTEPLPHLIDFLMPRKRPEPQRDKRQVYLVAAIAAAVLLMIVGSAGFIWWQRRAEIAELQTKLDALEKKTENAAALIADVGLIDRWKQGDVNWLDELYEISDRFPLPDDAIAQAFSGIVHNVPFEASINVRGLVSERRIEDAMVSSLTQRPYAITQGQSTPVSDNGTYTRSFGHTLVIDLSSRKIEDLVRTTPSGAATTSDANTPATTATDDTAPKLENP